MVKVKYNIRTKNGLVERIHNSDTFKLAIEFVRTELKGNENVVGKPVLEGEDNVG